MTIGKTFVAAFVAGVCLCTTRLVMQAQENKPARDSAAIAEIRHQVENYMQSIEAADTSLGAAVWSPTPSQRVWRILDRGLRTEEHLTSGEMLPTLRFERLSSTIAD